MATSSLNSDFSDVCKQIIVMASTGGAPDPELVTRVISELSERIKIFVNDIYKGFFGISSKLESIESKLDKTLRADYRAGLRSLEAARTTLNPINRKAHIEKARDEFHKAVEHVDDILVPLAHFYEGMCSELLGDIEVANLNYNQAFDIAWDYERKNGAAIATIVSFGKDRLIDYHNAFMLPLARLLISRQIDSQNDSAKDRLRRAKLVDLLQYPWDVRDFGRTLQAFEIQWDLRLDYLPTKTD